MIRTMLSTTRIARHSMSRSSRSEGSLRTRRSRLAHLGLAFLLALVAYVGVSAARGSAIPKASASSPPVTIGEVTGDFYPNPNNSGSFDPSQLSSEVFQQQFPVIDFNPPASAQVSCSNSTGVDENTRPFTDVVPNPDGSCNTVSAQGNGQQAGCYLSSPPPCSRNSVDLGQFEAVFGATLTVAAAGQVTFNFFSDDGWMLGIGQQVAGTAQPTYVSGTLYNAPPTSPLHGYSVVGAYNTNTSPVQEQVTVIFPNGGTYPIEVDYTECCGGQLSLTLGTTFGNPIPPTPSESIAVNGRAFTGLIGQQLPVPGPVGGLDPVAFFSDTDLTASPSDFTVAIDWGDPRDPNTSVGQVTPLTAPTSGCTGPGNCFMIFGGHAYQAAGTYQVTITVVNSVTHIGSDPGYSIVQVVAPGPAGHPPPNRETVQHSIGVVDGLYDLGTRLDNGQVCRQSLCAQRGCTATALQGVNVIVTAKHCGFSATDLHLANIEFAPQHTGNCFKNGVEMTLFDCGGNPYGVFTATPSADIVNVHDQAAAQGKCPQPGVQTTRDCDVQFIVMSGKNQQGQSLADAMKTAVPAAPGLPVVFNESPTDKWVVLGYPARDPNPKVDWTLEDCGPKNGTPPQQVSFGPPPVTVVPMMVGVACDLHAPNDCPNPAPPHPCGGQSGGPFVSSDVVPDGVGAADRGGNPDMQFGSWFGVGTQQAYLTAVLRSRDLVGVPALW